MRTEERRPPCPGCSRCTAPFHHWVLSEVLLGFSESGVYRCAHCDETTEAVLCVDCAELIPRATAAVIFVGGLPLDDPANCKTFRCRECIEKRLDAAGIR
jgi:hypothetical protein